MREALKIILGTAGWPLPPTWLAWLSRQALVLPFYHTVADHPMPMMRGVVPVRTVKQFTRDLDFFLRYFEAVGLDALNAYAAEGRPFRRPSFFLSLDDGLSGCYHLVAPVLEAKGIPAAFFVNTDFIDNRGLFYRYKAGLILERLAKGRYSPAITELIMSHYHLPRAGRNSVRRFIRGITYRDRHLLDEIAALLDLDFEAFLKVKQPYMTTDQLRDLHQRGFHIGSHGRDHPRFSDLDPAQQLQHYRQSMEKMDRMVPGHPGIFSFPFTDDGIRREFFQALAQSGNPPMASFGTAGLKKERIPRHHQRIPMETGHAGAGRLIRGEYLYYLLKALPGKNTITRK